MDRRKIVLREFGVIFAMTSIAITVMFYMSLIFFAHPPSLRSAPTSAIYTVSANWEMQHSELVNNTVNFCRPIGINQDLIECVVTQVGKYYNYTLRNESFPILIKADEIDEKGYICRDVAVVYSAIFRKLGLQSDYVFSKNHVYNSVYNVWGDKYLDCQINMAEWHCWGN